jgi:NADH:ubiquinone oxidoreductase subunit F (NADH-binding)
VQNVETLAHVARIARFGDEWFRSLGQSKGSGTTLVTVGGAVPQTVLIEIPAGLALAEAVNAAGGLTSDCDAVLLGGYFGGWVESTAAWALPLDAAPLHRLGYSLGCGVIAALPSGRCGVVETARILAYLAHESARQCGPCTFGLRAIAAASGRVSGLVATPGDLERIERWAGLLAGRGACRHPDGAAGLLASALRVFGAEFRLHDSEHRCSLASAAAAAS